MEATKLIGTWGYNITLQLNDDGTYIYTELGKQYTGKYTQVHDKDNNVEVLTFDNQPIILEAWMVPSSNEIIFNKSDGLKYKVTKL